MSFHHGTAEAGGKVGQNMPPYALPGLERGCSFLNETGLSTGGVWNP